METINQKRKLPQLWLLNNNVFIIILLIFIPEFLQGQCLSSVNPVGGTNNLLVLEKQSLRVITFYKYGQGTQHYTENQRSDFDLISKAFYNYWSTTLGYGVTNKFTLELESGYFFNKTQVYNLEPEYRLRGYGLSNLVAMGKYSLFAEPVKRIYLTGGLGAKIPYTRKPQLVDNVEIPVEVQPTIGAFGMVFNLAFVKENSEKGLRYFIISRSELNDKNIQHYKLGNSFYNSVYVSKHIMQKFLNGDWTVIFQLRNEIRLQDKINKVAKESSGSNLFYFSPQLNYVYKENWYISTMLDIPLYQNFNGTQLGANPGITLIFSRTFRL